MEKRIPAYRFRLMLVSLLILFSFSISDRDISGWNKITDPQYELYGTIYCREKGIPINNVEVILYRNAGEITANPSHTVITNENGVFRFNVEKDRSYVLDIHGSQGTGRKYIPAGYRARELEIEYPVVEKVVIVHTNDHHFTFNKLPEFKAAVDRLREKYDDVFLFCSGDIFVRHPDRWIVNGRLMRNPGWYGERAMYMINSMNELGYDLMTPGNHEFAYREPYTRQALDAAQFPLVAANVRISTDAFPPVEKYVVFKTSTWRNMTVVGLSNGSAEGIRLLDLSETVNQLMHLRDSCEIFVALTHIGLRRDRALAEEFPQFDVIIGGHSHDLLKDAITVNSVLVAQAGGNPHFVSDHYPVFIGKVVLTLENGVIREKSGRVIEIGDPGPVEGTKKRSEIEFFAVPEF